jgi:hypothetical protein
LSEQAASLKKEAKKLNAKRLVLPTIKLSEAQYTTISEEYVQYFPTIGTCLKSVLRREVLPEKKKEIPSISSA